jgi:hypothetical protein
MSTRAPAPGEHQTHGERKAFRVDVRRVQSVEHVVEGGHLAALVRDLIVFVNPRTRN